MKQSEHIAGQITEAGEKQQSLENELTQLGHSLDELARQPEVDPKAAASLQKRRSQIEIEREIVARRLAALGVERRDAEVAEAAQRLIEIGREYTALRSQAEGLMTTIAEACAAITQTLADLRPLLWQHERLDHGREFVSLRYRLPSSALPRLPEPARDFLRPLERAREDLRRFGADEWQRKAAALRAELRGHIVRGPLLITDPRRG